MQSETTSKTSSSQQHSMSLRFALATPAHIIATFFGSGVLRPASGTWGTLAGWLFYMVLHHWLGLGWWILLIIASFFIGAWASGATGDDIGVHDHNSIVIDEVFAIWLVLVTVPNQIGWQIVAFCAFRFFDIVKIQPAKYFDSNWHWRNGWGVMLDDAVAGIYAILLLLFLRCFS